MNNKPKIGVVIPVYKVKREYFDECLNSVINQSYKNLQIILVDDCSPEKCGDWCDEYAKKDSRIEVLHHKHNVGVSEARNSALQLLDCDWITYIDADDWIDTDTFDNVINKINICNDELEVVMFQGAMNYTDIELRDTIDEDHLYAGRLELDALQTKALSIPLKNYPSNKYIAYDTAWGKLISTKFLQRSNVKFRKIAYKEDTLFFQELIQCAAKVLEISEGCYHYRMVETSAVHSYRKNELIDQDFFLDFLWNFAQKNNKNDDYIKALYAITIISMQVVVTNYYFHKANRMPFKIKQKDCNVYFQKEHFQKVFDFIKMSDLKSGFMIKAFCLKHHWYYLLVLLRNVFFLLKRFKSFV